MKKAIYILVTLIALSSCQQKSNVPDDVKWTITQEDENSTLGKNNIEVNLNKKIDNGILKEIALEIQRDREQYDNLFIFYRLNGNTDGMAWATTHFNPDLDVKILGSTEAQDSETSKTDDIDGTIKGKWRSDKSLMGASLILFENPKGKNMMRITFKDGSKMESELAMSEQNGKTKYSEDNEHGEYYILESNGNLGMYDTEGKFDEAVKME